MNRIDTNKKRKNRKGWDSCRYSEFPAGKAVKLALVMIALLWVMPGLALAQSLKGVLREVYLDLPGSAIADLTNSTKFPSQPDVETIQPDFEAPNNFGDNYGTRLRALVLPPQTGSYLFWISGDDQCVLYLSTDDTPANKRVIAKVNSWTSPREWTKETNQQSAPVTLTAGKRYYLEALQKEGGGGDNLGVRWQLPGGVWEANDSSLPIPYERLLVYGLTAPVITRQPANLAVQEGDNARFTVELTRYLGASFQWQRNSTNIPGAVNQSYELAGVKLADSGSKFRVVITNSLGTVTSSNVILTVYADTIRPVMLSVTGLGDDQTLSVLFSEPMEAATALAVKNYALDYGAAIQSAALGDDLSTVILATAAPLRHDVTYTLTVNNVRDRALRPNVILPNASRTFSLKYQPLDLSVLPSYEPAGPCSRRTSLVISEIMFAPLARADGRLLEFVELYNSQEWAEEIGGFRLTGAVDYTFAPGAMIPARGYLVLAAKPADVEAVYGLTGVLAYTNSLPRKGGTLRLRNRQNAILLEVQYSNQPPWPVAASRGGHSLVLARPTLGERNPRAWAASDLRDGSPGRAEAPMTNPYRAIFLNELSAHNLPPEPDFVELFNYGNAQVNLVGCALTDDPATNKYVFPSDAIIPSLGFLSLDATQLGFGLNSEGETLYLLNPGATKVLDAIHFGPQPDGQSLGRYPDGAPEFRLLAARTPGLPNARPTIPGVVINEIMYHPISDRLADQYVELHNPGTQAVSVAGWQLSGAIDFRFPPGAQIPAAGYLVVAADTERLLAQYAGLNPRNTLGNFSGKLSANGERLVLQRPEPFVLQDKSGGWATNYHLVEVDSVTYGPGGRWGKWANGGGSSLELTDPRASHALAPNWADSDETAKSPWITIQTTGRLDNGQLSADGLQVFMMGPGEALVDDVEVVPSGSTNIIANGQFENGPTGWFAQGNQDRSQVEFTGGFLNSACLHLRATGRGDTGANRVRTAMTRSLVDGSTATIRAKVRWLKGFPEILFRFRGGLLELATNIVATQALGTPGARNSQARNAPPAITDVTHYPVLPKANQAVTVIARVEDPDGLALLNLKYRIDPATNILTISFTNNGAGYFSATIPGQATAVLAAFYIEARDNHPQPATARFPDNAPDRECLVRWGEPATPAKFGAYRVWLTKATIDRWSKREKLSNDALDATFVCGSSRLIYNIGGMYAGSPWHAPGFNSPVGNYCDYVLDFPADDAWLNDEEISLLLPGNGCCDATMQTEQTAYWIANELGLPFTYRRPVHVFFNGVRRAPALMDDSQQPNADFVKQWYPDSPDGHLHKVQVWFEFDATASTFNAIGASLGNWTTTGGVKKLARYRWNWPARAFGQTANDYAALFGLHSAATSAATGENYRNVVQNYIDVDQWARTFAVEHLVGNSDSWGNGGGQNMYTYKPDNDTWKLLIWDIDFAFVAATPTTDVFQFGDTYLGKIYTHPAFRRMFYQVLLEVANGPLTTNRVNALLDRKYTGLATAGVSVSKPDSIKTYISQRRTYLLQQLARVNAPFAVTFNGASQGVTNRNAITLSGTAPLQMNSLRINGVEYPLTWTSITNFTLPLALSPGTNQILAQGFDRNGKALTNAPKELLLAYTGADSGPTGQVVINEIMYNPPSPGANYVELFNRSPSQAFDLAGWQLQGADYVFPRSSVIPPSGYLLLAGNRTDFATAYGSNLVVAGEFNGQLNNGGETLSLKMPGSAAGQEVVVDSVTYDNQTPWPLEAGGLGASLQLIDPAQDNDRPGNWQAVPTNWFLLSKNWQFVSATGKASSTRLSFALQSAGEVYLDDIRMVPGTVATSGINLLTNGSWELPFPGSWKISPNYSGSGMASNAVRTGQRSLRLAANASGSSDSMYMDFKPALTNGQTYTLSFWYLAGPASNTLTARLLFNWISTNVAIIPNTSQAMARFTPGTSNSVRATLPAFPSLWLNEIHPQPAPSGSLYETNAWVEIYNAGSNAVSLAGLALTDSLSNWVKWPFPAQAGIGPGQFALVWLDGQAGLTDRDNWHASFTVAPDRGLLMLVLAGEANPLVLDSLRWNSIGSQRSFGAYPDGARAGRREFARLTPGAPNDPAYPPLTLWLNEWMADNTRTLMDPVSGQFNDWFELFNPTDKPADLGGLYLTDDLANPTQFHIPNGYAVPPHGYLLVWADDRPGDNTTNSSDLHVNFKLDNQGESLGLFAPDGALVDAVSFGPQTPDVSQGRLPDGGQEWMTFTNPTPRAANLLGPANHPPLLDPLPNRVTVKGRTLAFAISATDTDQPPQTLAFDLVAPVPAGAVINPVTGWFQWTPELLGTNAITVRVSDSGLPPLSDAKTFHVVVIDTPLLVQATLDGDTFLITWSASPGQPYRLEYATDLAAPRWQPLGEKFIAAAGRLTIPVDIDLDPHRFYRLLWLP